jgi:hypothetical protein
MLLSQLYAGSAGGGGGPAPPTVPYEYVGKVQDAGNGRSSYDWPSVLCGATGENRTMVFVVWLETSSGEFTTPTITVDEDPITFDRTQNLLGGRRFVGIFRARPTGGTCNIQISGFTANADNNVIYVYRSDALIELHDRTRYDYQSANTSSATIRRTLAVPADGFMIGFAGIAADSGSPTISYGGDIAVADDSASDGSSVTGEVFSYDNDGNPDDVLIWAVTPSAAVRRSVCAVSYAYQAIPAAKRNALFTLLGNIQPANNRTYKVRIPATALAALPSGTNRLKFRFTTALNVNAVALDVNKAYVGHAAPSGDPYDAASLTQILFEGGNASFTITNSNVNGMESDPVTFAYDGVSDLILSLYVNSASPCIPTNTLTGAGTYSNPGDSAATANVSSFTEHNTNLIAFVECIRGWVEP